MPNNSLSDRASSDLISSTCFSGLLFSLSVLKEKRQQISQTSKLENFFILTDNLRIYLLEGGVRGAVGVVFRFLLLNAIFSGSSSVSSKNG